MSIPRSKNNDYTQKMATERRRFLSDETETFLDHVGQYSMNPEVFAGNVENFIGAA